MGMCVISKLRGICMTSYIRRFNRILYFIVREIIRTQFVLRKQHYNSIYYSLSLIEGEL